MPTIHVGPIAFVEQRVLSAGECEAIVECLELRRGRHALTDDELPYAPHLRAIIAEVTHHPPEHQEPWVAYEIRAGVDERPHRDYLERDDVRRARPGGERLWGALLFLTSRGMGGGQAFPALGVRVASEAGILLVWNLADGTHRALPESLRQPVAPMAGSEHGLLTWVRQGPADAPEGADPDATPTRPFRGLSRGA